MIDYGYNEYMTDALLNMFRHTEIIEILKANDMKRPTTIRTNKIKTRRKDLVSMLLNRGINLDLNGMWSNEGLIIYDSTLPLGSTPEYMAGYFMTQSASSFFPCIVLAPQINEIVVDMVSSTGRKTSHVSALMHNTGIIFANEVETDKHMTLSSNLERMGVTNTIICSYNSLDLFKVMRYNSIDRVILDAPCSGTGLISKYSSFKVTKNSTDTWKCVQKQKRLILTALDMVNGNSKSGGCVLYSTCSIMVEENENVINYALRKRKVYVNPCDSNIGRPGFNKFRGLIFHPSIKKCLRFYPHIHNLDGVFICKLGKKKFQYHEAIL
jgi:ribosomal RNA methyltransferase Nop2